jgi:hypothetical protein
VGLSSPLISSTLQITARLKSNIWVSAAMHTMLYELTCFWKNFPLPYELEVPTTEPPLLGYLARSPRPDAPHRSAGVPNRLTHTWRTEVSIQTADRRSML